MIRAFYHSIMPNSLLRFLVSGAANTLASYALYLLLLRFISYLWAYSLAYAAGIALLTYFIVTTYSRPAVEKWGQCWW